MATTTSPNMGPRVVRSSNTPLYWGVAILAAVIIALALLMRPTRVAAPTAATDVAATAQGLDTTPATNAAHSTQVDPATGRAYTTDPTTGAIIQNEKNPTYDANGAPAGSDSRVNGMGTDPRAEQLHNGANSPNGGIAPNNNPASQPPNTPPSGY